MWPLYSLMLLRWEVGADLTALVARAHRQQRRGVGPGELDELGPQARDLVAVLAEFGVARAPLLQQGANDDQAFEGTGHNDCPSSIVNVEPVIWAERAESR